MARTTRTAKEPYEPPRLVVPADDAKRQVQLRIETGRALLEEQVTDATYEGYSERARRWDSVTSHLLASIVSKRDWADSFSLTGSYQFYPRGTMLHVRLANVQSGLRRQIGNLEGVLEKIDLMVALPAPIDIDSIPDGPRKGPVTVKMGDNYGTVVVDSLTKNIENNVKRGLDGQEVMDAFKTLADAFQNDTELAESVRADVLQYLDVLAQESATPPEKRRPAVITTMFAAISAVLGAATKAGQAYDTLQPIIDHALRISGH